MNSGLDDERWMQEALTQARHALDQGEVPVGAVLVAGDEVIARGWNHPIGACDPTLHAEIHALRAGAAALGNYRLPGTTLFVTLEPCAMCAGAIVHARVERVVYGATDPKTGAVESVFRLLDSNPANHRVAFRGGVLADDCGALLREFFAARR